MYCIVEVKKSQNAGIANHKGLNYVYFPFDFASNILILKDSGSLFFIAKYTNRHKNYPTNIVVALF